MSRGGSGPADLPLRSSVSPVVRYRPYVTCPMCVGMGSVKAELWGLTRHIACSTCNGHGTIKASRADTSNRSASEDRTEQSEATNESD